MIDIVERLDGYNPPDRTTDDQRQIAQDIYDAKNYINNLRFHGFQLAADSMENLKAEVERLQKTVDALQGAVKAGGDKIERLRTAIRKYLSHQLSHQESYVVLRAALDEKNYAVSQCSALSNACEQDEGA